MNTEEFMRRLTAILRADVEGYSRPMAGDDAATVRLIWRPSRRLRLKDIRNHTCLVVGSPGDNVLAEFAGDKAKDCAHSRGPLCSKGGLR